jgi:molybdopterin/thiamine biosynthesis adenylyltransferase
MTELVISAVALRYLTQALDAEVEGGAVLYLNHDVTADRYLVHEMSIAAAEDHLHASRTEITFAPQFLVGVTRRARESNRSLALVHTHPAGFADFSVVDDKTEAGLADFMRSRNPGRECFSLVLCDGHLIARRFGTTDRVAVREVGENVAVSSSLPHALRELKRYDRQVRAFGQDGQAILRTLTVAIVGVGGTGSVAAQQLAHLGIARFVLVDPDVIEETNLNRVVGANERSIGREKVESAAEFIRQINPAAEVKRYKGSVMSHGATALLRSADCVFICTDSHVSRAYLSEFSYQYLIPAFDIGVSINARAGKVEAVTGRTQMLAPGLPCLSCSNALNTQRIREELMTPKQRAADPYFNEGGATQPAVISINSAMVSMAITMFLGAFTAIPVRARWQSYDALTGTVRLLSTKPDANCGVCGSAGVTGAGYSRQLTLLQPEHD